MQHGKSKRARCDHDDHELVSDKLLAELGVREAWDPPELRMDGLAGRRRVTDGGTAS